LIRIAREGTDTKCAQRRGGKWHLVRGGGEELDGVGIGIAGVDACKMGTVGVYIVEGTRGTGVGVIWVLWYRNKGTRAQSRNTEGGKDGEGWVSPVTTVDVHYLHRVVLPDRDIQDGVEGW
jgi:hypothetical protein